MEIRYDFTGNKKELHRLKSPVLRVLLWITAVKKSPLKGGGPNTLRLRRNDCLPRPCPPGSRYTCLPRGPGTVSPICLATPSQIPSPVPPLSPPYLLKMWLRSSLLLFVFVRLPTCPSPLNLTYWTNSLIIFFLETPILKWRPLKPFNLWIRF